MLLPPEEVISKIRGFGFVMFVGEDGVVHGKPSEPGKRVPFEMQPYLEQLRLQNDAIAEIIRGEDAIVDLKNLSPAEAQPWLDKVQAGEYRLVGKVTYYRKSNTASFMLERIAKEDGNGQ